MVCGSSRGEPAPVAAVRGALVFAVVDYSRSHQPHVDDLLASALRRYPKVEFYFVADVNIENATAFRDADVQKRIGALVITCDEKEAAAFAGVLDNSTLHF
jgi:hypothetical protein